MGFFKIGTYEISSAAKAKKNVYLLGKEVVLIRRRRLILEIDTPDRTRRSRKGAF